MRHLEYLRGDRERIARLLDDISANAAGGMDANLPVLLLQEALARSDAQIASRSRAVMLRDYARLKRIEAGQLRACAVMQIAPRRFGNWRDLHACADQSEAMARMAEQEAETLERPGPRAEPPVSNVIPITLGRPPSLARLFPEANLEAAE